METPDFTGVWNFCPGRSALQIAAPDATVFRIEHREPRFHLSRTHVIGGQSDTFSLDLITDGTEVVCRRGDLEIRATARWEGPELVCASELARGGDRGSNVVRYRLADEGRCLVAEERFRSERLSYLNTWVFEKQ